MAGHSKARSFLFKKAKRNNDNIGVMFCKQSALHPEWIGYQDSSNNGFEFLTDHPGGFPSKLILKKIPTQFLKDIPSFYDLDDFNHTWVRILEIQNFISLEEVHKKINI